MPSFLLSPSYSNCAPTDPFVVYFWTVLGTLLTPADRSLFIQFVWGRSRLPASANEFERPFKLQRMAIPASRRPGKDEPDRTAADKFLPVAHTCFFSLDLPPFSSLEVTHARLLYAIHNSIAIDADSTDRADQAAHQAHNQMEELEEEEQGQEEQ